jgi:hypothetical protein
MMPSVGRGTLAFLAVAVDAGALTALACDDIGVSAVGPASSQLFL